MSRQVHQSSVPPSLVNGLFDTNHPPRKLGWRIRQNKRIEVPEVVLRAFNRFAVPVERFLDEGLDAHVAVLLSALEHETRLYWDGTRIYAR